MHSFIYGLQVPEFESSSSSADDNPWVSHKAQLNGSINLPPKDWLCGKIEKYKIALVEGYPSRGLGAVGLQKDYFEWNPSC